MTIYTSHFLFQFIPCYIIGTLLYHPFNMFNIMAQFKQCCTNQGLQISHKQDNAYCFAVLLAGPRVARTESY